MTTKRLGDDSTVNPEVSTPDPPDRADASFLIWQALGGIRESIGRLEGKLDATNTNVTDLKRQVAGLTTKISKAKSSVDRIYWTIAAIAVILGVLSPILWAGLKVILKIH